MIRILLATLILASLGLTLAGCQTVSGMGKDTKETWNWATGTPRDEAYHQHARDF